MSRSVERWESTPLESVMPRLATVNRKRRITYGKHCKQILCSIKTAFHLSLCDSFFECFLAAKQIQPATRKQSRTNTANPPLTLSLLLVIGAVPVLRDALWSVLVRTEDSERAYALENRILAKSSPARSALLVLLPCRLPAATFLLRELVILQKKYVK